MYTAVLLPEGKGMACITTSADDLLRCNAAVRRTDRASIYSLELVQVNVFVMELHQIDMTLWGRAVL